MDTFKDRQVLEDLYGQGSRRGRSGRTGRLMLRAMLSLPERRAARSTSCASARTATTSRSAAAGRSSGWSRSTRTPASAGSSSASNDVRAAEAQGAAERFLHGAGKADIRIERFRESYFPWVGAEHQGLLRALKATSIPT